LHVADPDVSLQQFGFRKNERFSYIYDMGDHWEHEIRIEAINPPPKKSYPTCIGGSGACPPEDCGGVDGYLERQDEAEGYDAWRDMDIMTGFLEDVVAADAPDRPVSDFMSDDVEAAMARIAARKPFVEGNFELLPKPSHRMKGQKWPTFTPPATALCRRYRGRVLLRRSHPQRPLLRENEVARIDIGNIRQREFV